MEITSYTPTRCPAWTYQNSTYQLSDTDRKITTCPTLGEMIVGLGILLASASVILSFTISPAYILGVIPAAIISLLGMYMFDGTGSAICSHSHQNSITGQPIGLINRGNTCFLNAAIQYLRNIPQYTQTVCMIPTLHTVQQGMFKAEQNKQAVSQEAHTGAVREWLKTVSTHSLGGGQDDPSILLEYVLKQLFAPLPITKYVYHFNPLTAPTTPAEKQYLLTVPLTSSNFSQEFNQLFWDESVANMNLIQQFITAPAEFSIRLARFDNNLHKVGTHMDFPEQLTLEEEKHLSGTSAVYDYDAFIEHEGNSMIGGHYVAYVKTMIDGRETFWKCDDSRVTSITQKEFRVKMGDAFWIHVTKTPSLEVPSDEKKE